jgi:hypothetical protein
LERSLTSSLLAGPVDLLLRFSAAPNSAPSIGKLF